MNTFHITRNAEGLQHQGLTSPSPEARELSRAQLLLESIADGTTPEMLLFIFNTDGTSSAVIAIPDSNQVELLDAKGERIGYAMSRWTTCDPDVEAVRALTKQHQERFAKESSKVSGFMPYVVVVCRHMPSVQLVGQSRKELAVGYLYATVANQIEPGFSYHVRDIQALLNG